MQRLLAVIVIGLIVIGLIVNVHAAPADRAAVVHWSADDLKAGRAFGLPFVAGGTIDNASPVADMPGRIHVPPRQGEYRNLPLVAY